MLNSCLPEWLFLFSSSSAPVPSSSHARYLKRPVNHGQYELIMIYLCWFVLYIVLSTGSNYCIEFQISLSLSFLLYFRCNQSTYMSFSLTQFFVYFQINPLNEVTSSSSFQVIGCIRWYTSCLLKSTAVCLGKCAHKVVECYVHQELHIFCHYKLMHTGSGS